MVKAIEKTFSYRGQRDLESMLKRSRKQKGLNQAHASPDHLKPAPTNPAITR